MIERFEGKWKLVMAAVFVVGMAAGALVIEALPGSSGKADPAAQDVSPEENTAGNVRIESAAQRNIGLQFARAQVRSVERTILATGTVSPNETRLAHLRPIARGRVETVNVRLGDRVRAGQVLLVYDNVDLGETIGLYSAAVAALNRARAEAEVTRRSLERARSLVKLGALAEAEFDRRSAEYENANASIESQAADLAKTEEKLHRFGLSEQDIRTINTREGAGSHREASHTSMTAPFDGIVIKSSVATGETFGPEDEIFVLADLSTAWVLADVYEKDIAAVSVGQQARIVADSYPDATFLGRITYVSDFLDPRTRTAKVRCEVPNPNQKLKLDMFVTIELPAAPERKALLVPAEAIQQVNDRPVVFVRVSDDEFEPRKVELGATSDSWVEVKTGINDGETVAAHGSFFLKSTLLRSQIGGDE